MSTLFKDQTESSFGKEYTRLLLFNGTIGGETVATRFKQRVERFHQGNPPNFE